jgi:hypothetical protein
MLDDPENKTSDAVIWLQKSFALVDQAENNSTPENQQLKVCSR